MSAYAIHHINGKLRDNDIHNLTVVDISENLGGITMKYTNNTGFTIRTNIFLATSDGGFADLNLTNAKTLRGAIVEFYDDAGVYVSTL